MKNNVEFLLNKDKKLLEIVGYTNDQVKEGYANYIKLLKVDTKASSSKSIPSKDKKFTHFLALNMEHDANITKIQQEILACRIGNFKKDYVNPPNKFHLTLGLMDVESTDRVVEVINKNLQKLQQITMGETLNLTFERPGFFGKPTAAHVLTLELKRDAQTQRLNDMNSALVKLLIDDGIISQDDLKKQKVKFFKDNLQKAQHLTLAKCQKNQKMDVSDVLAKNFSFDIKVPITSFDLMSMKKEEMNSSYPIVYSFSLIS